MDRWVVRRSHRYTSKFLDLIIVYTIATKLSFRTFFRFFVYFIVIIDALTTIIVSAVIQRDPEVGITK